MQIANALLPGCALKTREIATQMVMAMCATTVLLSVTLSNLMLMVMGSVMCVIQSLAAEDADCRSVNNSVKLKFVF